MEYLNGRLALHTYRLDFVDGVIFYHTSLRGRGRKKIDTEYYHLITIDGMWYSVYCNYSYSTVEH